jgi:hypothetical protein
MAMLLLIARQDASGFWQAGSGTGDGRTTRKRDTSLPVVVRGPREGLD